MKEPHKQGVDAVQAGLLNMSEQEKNVEADFLAHVFWGVLDDICRHFSNPLSPEAAQARYMDTKSVWLHGTRLGHMADKLACNEPLMNVSVPRKWLGRGATASAGDQSLGPIRKYQGVWQPLAGYPPYVPQKQAKYGHQLVFMPKNEAHGQVGQIQLGTPGVGKYTAECEQKAEIFRAKYPERYTRGTSTEVHPMIAGMMQNYNKKFSKLRISNLCKLAGVKNY